MQNTICIDGVNFQKINERSFKKLDLSEILFVMISQSGVVDWRGTVYIFTPTAAFLMDKEDYNDGFLDELFLFVSEWNSVNVYFCDFVIIRPDIYDSFVRELCARNLPFFWFDTAIEVYKIKYCD